MWCAGQDELGSDLGCNNTNAQQLLGRLKRKRNSTYCTASSSASSGDPNGGRQGLVSSRPAFCPIKLLGRRGALDLREWGAQYRRRKATDWSSLRRSFTYWKHTLEGTKMPSLPLPLPTSKVSSFYMIQFVLLSCTDCCRFTGCCCFVCTLSF